MFAQTEVLVFLKLDPAVEVKLCFYKDYMEFRAEVVLGVRQVLHHIFWKSKFCFYSVLLIIQHLPASILALNIGDFLQKV